MNYSDQLKSPKWQKKRLEILKRDKFMCKLCGDDETELHVHHLEYNGMIWEVPNDKLITYCKHCHEVIERYKKEYENEIVKFIYKDNHWNNKHIILFIGTDVKLSMEIYDKNDKFIVGFNFSSWHLYSLIKVFRKSIKFIKNG